MTISILTGGDGQRGEGTPCTAMQVVPCTRAPSQSGKERLQSSQALLPGNEP